MTRRLLLPLLAALALAVQPVAAQSPAVTSRVAALGAFDVTWKAIQAEVESTFRSWASALADTQRQQLAELAVVSAIAELDDLSVETCFRAIWANARSSLVLRAESYIAVVAAQARSTVDVWASVESAITFLTGAQRLSSLVQSERVGVDCVGSGTGP